MPPTPGDEKDCQQATDSSWSHRDSPVTIQDTIFSPASTREARKLLGLLPAQSKGAFAKSGLIFGDEMKIRGACGAQ